MQNPHEKGGRGKEAATPPATTHRQFRLTPIWAGQPTAVLTSVCDGLRRNPCIRDLEVVGGCIGGWEKGRWIGGLRKQHMPRFSRACPFLWSGNNTQQPRCNPSSKHHCYLPTCVLVFDGIIHHRHGLQEGPARAVRGRTTVAAAGRVTAGLHLRRPVVGARLRVPAESGAAGRDEDVLQSRLQVRPRTRVRWGVAGNPNLHRKAAPAADFARGHHIPAWAAQRNQERSELGPQLGPPGTHARCAERCSMCAAPLTGCFRVVQR